MHRTLDIDSCHEFLFPEIKEVKSPHNLGAVFPIFGLQDGDPDVRIFIPEA
jgi:hypothetical protein